MGQAEGGLDAGGEEADEEGLPWCVGCGRCTAFCPADISIPDIVNELIREDEKAQLNRSVRV